MNVIFRTLFKWFGWKLVGQVPQDLHKALFVVCPHALNTDFFVGLGARAEMRRSIKYLGKSDLFKPPFGFIFRALGGIPVYRNASHNLVESMVNAVKNVEEGLICLAPEGTRKNVAKLKSGFYYISLGANIPIVRIGFDYDKKEVVIAEPVYMTGNFQEDMKTYFVPFYEKIGGIRKDWVANYKKDIF